MIHHIKRHTGIICSILVLCVAASPAVDWLCTHYRLPAGYGAEGDRRRATRVPGTVRTTVEALSAGADGNWVREGAEDGAWGYELHTSKGGQETVTRITPDGRVIPAASPSAEPELGTAAEAGG